MFWRKIQKPNLAGDGLGLAGPLAGGDEALLGRRLRGGNGRRGGS